MTHAAGLAPFVMAKNIAHLNTTCSSIASNLPLTNVSLSLENGTLVRVKAPFFLSMYSENPSHHEIVFSMMGLLSPWSPSAPVASRPGALFWYRGASIVGDVLLAAAFVSYAGAFSKDYREELWRNR